MKRCIDHIHLDAPVGKGVAPGRLFAPTVRSCGFSFLLVVAVSVVLTAGCPPETPDAPTADPPPSTQEAPPEPPDEEPTTQPTTASIAGRLTVQSDTASDFSADLGFSVGLTEARFLAGLVPGDEVSLANDASVTEDFVPGELLVTFEEDVPPDQQEAILTVYGLDLVQCSPSGVCRASVAFPKEEAGSKDERYKRIITLDSQAQLAGKPGIRHVECNARRYIALTPDDDYYPLQWHYTAINLPQAWDYTVGSDEIVVAVVDTGIVSGHPDLQGRLVAGYDFIADLATSRDGDGLDPDPEDPGDLFGGPGQSSFHGTHVAGTIAAATDNAIGVAGVTWQTKIMPVRALGVDGGTSFDVAEAIRFAAGLPNVSGQVPATPAHVINLSLTGAAGEPASAAELAALAAASQAGVVVVAAAGNERSSLPSFPAAAPETISVNAVDIQLELASYSNFGSTIDLAAPGGFTGTDLNGDGFADGVVSTAASDLTGSIEFEYAISNGTSMAAPHVAGVAALVLAANPDLSADEVREILESTAMDLGEPGRDDIFGHGLIDAAAAVRETLGRAGQATTTEPNLSLSTRSLDFDIDHTTLTVQITNTGGGFLELTGFSVDETDADGWLQAELTGSTSNADATGLNITVDRTDLPDGTYRGTVTVSAADLEPATVNVSMTVGESSLLAETVYVLAVAPVTLDTAAQAKTNDTEDFAYTIGDLPAGSYVVYAGTDRDNDGFICENGDLCGALPSTIAPRILNLEPGQELADADFSVARLILQQSAGKESSTVRLRRIESMSD